MNNSLNVQKQGGIVTATLNRPEQRNAFDDEMILGLESLVAEINEDRSLKVLIITGAGSAFCAGGDVKQMQNKTGMFGGSTNDIRQQYRFGIQRIPRAMYDLEVPAIAAVNGPAYGAGCDLTTMCDIRIASPKAVFAESFVKLGLIPGDGGAWLLPRTVGMSRAAEMTFTGDPVDAETAQSWGLVSKVVAADELLREANNLAARIASNPAEAIRASKRLLVEGQKQSLQSILELSASLQASLHHSEDHAEAVAAMLEKRKPNFK